MWWNYAAVAAIWMSRGPVSFLLLVYTLQAAIIPGAMWMSILQDI